MCSSMNVRTRWRISLISGVIARSGIGSSLTGREVLKPSQALLCLGFRVSLSRNDVEDGRRDSHVTIELDSFAAFFRAAEHEDIIDDTFRHQPQRLRPVACLPGLHHRREEIPATPPPAQRTG